ncbi:hypothetical protein Desgi_2247 [Desulfoscipio gibsoniae DSM 7213]|uniref:Uncharacterized protein n=1 Tax=Desulfoscipio gibsoniae DSM 7213 TaxID=767817 RepID=R4KEP7_9FIRM|nr:hypothetical protein Desgi_2247 [Desulfoscipio gibsoniae DSM 7213]
MKKIMDTAERNGGLVNQMLDKAAKGKAAAQAKMPPWGPMSTGSSEPELSPS